MPTKLKNQHENSNSSNSQVENLNAREVDANPTQTKCALAFDAFNELCCLLDVQYEFLCMQSNIIGSTARKSHGGSDLSESMNLVQAHALRFIKLVRLFVVEAEGLDHSGTHEAAVDEYVAAFLNNARAFNDEIDLQLLSMNHGNIADLSDPYVRDLIATENYFAKTLLAATEEIIRSSESAISRLIDALLAKTDTENFEAVELLSAAIDKTEAQLGRLVEATVSCVKGIQNLIEYGSAAFIEKLALADKTAKTDSVAKAQTQPSDLANMPYLPYSDEQVLKIGYAAMKVLSALHHHSFTNIAGANNNWQDINRTELELQFANEHYSSSRISNAMLILDGLGYVEFNASQMSQSVEHYSFRVNYAEIAKSLITEVVVDDVVAGNTPVYGTNAELSTDKVDAVRNTKMPFVVYASAEKCATVRQGRRSYSRKFMIADKDLPMAA